MTIGTIEASFIIFAAGNIGALIWREAIATEREKEMRAWRDRVDKALGMNGSGPDGAAFVRVSSFNSMAERMADDRESTAREFATIREMMETDRLVFERRANDQSSKLLALAQAVGVNLRREP